MKICSTLLVIREMQIKTKLRYYHMPIRMAIIYMSTNNKCWRGCGEKGTLVHCWWECKLVHPLWKTMEVSQKIKNRTTIWSRISIPGYVSGKKKNTNLKRYMHSKFIAALFIIAETQKQTKCPSTDQWIKKMWCV